MIARSIRARLALWYIATLTLAMLALGAGTWWLARHSVGRAADESLRGRIEGVVDFLSGFDGPFTTAELLDEFHEYVELTRGGALLEVIDSHGTVFCQPTIPSWAVAIARHHRVPQDGIAFDETPIDGQPYRVASVAVDVRGQRFHVRAALLMGPAYDALARFDQMLALMLPCVLLIAGAGGYWISGRALRPVDRMTREAQAITLERLDRRLEVPSTNDELERLARTFNDVLRRLQRSVEQMARFTADASHELRTPVSLIRTSAELALRRDRTSAEYREALTEILAYSGRMSLLVSDLLTLARADAGVERLDAQPVDVAALVLAACREVEAQALERGIRLRPELSSRSLFVDAYLPSLQRLLAILLDNALKYSPTGTVVIARIEKTTLEDGRQGVRCVVINEGQGVTATELPHVFDRFFRGNDARRLDPDGSGLGLSMARAIVLRLSGDITVAAARPEFVDAPGWRVDVVLPLGSATAAEPASLTTAAS